MAIDTAAESFSGRLVSPVDFELENRIVAAIQGSGQVKSELEALLVVQHCRVRGMSVLEYLQSSERLSSSGVAGQSPADSGAVCPPVVVPDAVPVVASVDPAEEGAKYFAWEKQVLIRDRLEQLRKHLLELDSLPRRSQISREYVDHLRARERSLSANVEPAGTLPLVSEDRVAAKAPEPQEESDDAFDSEDDSDSDPVPFRPPVTQSEKDEIASVLANPAAAIAATANAPAAVRRDSRGRELVSDDQLAVIFDKSARLGVPRQLAEERICEKNRLRKVGDLLAGQAKEMIAQLDAKLASVAKNG